MIIKSKYKIARRVGAPVFEKTQTQKYAAREGRRQKRMFSRSDYGIQLVEKQKARYTYCLTSKQFSKYVKYVLEKKGANQQEMLFGLLERRLDNVIARAGFGATRLGSRQIVSHGHIMVNGKRVTIPSYQVKIGEKVTIRPGSSGSKLFAGLDEKLKTFQSPSWMTVDAEKKVITIQGEPKLAQTELLFNLAPVLEFYSR
jgi:small subunit ribosomal protein S4